MIQRLCILINNTIKTGIGNSPKGLPIGLVEVALDVYDSGLKQWSL